MLRHPPSTALLCLVDDGGGVGVRGEELGVQSARVGSGLRRGVSRAPPRGHRGRCYRITVRRPSLIGSAPDGQDWFYRPVERGLCSYTDLIYGPITLYDVAEMNDIIDLMDENRARIDKAQADG